MVEPIFSDRARSEDMHEHTFARPAANSCEFCIRPMNLTIVAALIYIVPYMKLEQRILGVGASSTTMLFLVMGLLVWLL